jgi:hypothetical protein
MARDLLCLTWDHEIEFSYVNVATLDLLREINLTQKKDFRGCRIVFIMFGWLKRKLILIVELILLEARVYDFWLLQLILALNFLLDPLLHKYTVYLCTWGIPGSIPRGNNAWPLRMPLRTSRISRPPLVDRKPVRKPKKKIHSTCFYP